MLFRSGPSLGTNFIVEGPEFSLLALEEISSADWVLNDPPSKMKVKQKYSPTYKYFKDRGRETTVVFVQYIVVMVWSTGQTD